MKLLARIPVQVGSTDWRLEFVEGLGDQGECDGSERAMRIEYEPDLGKEELLRVAFHEWLHAVDYVYKLNMSEQKVRVLEQEFSRFLAAMQRLGLLLKGK